MTSLIILPELKQQIRTNLGCFDYQVANDEENRKAAVALTVVTYENDGGVYGMATDGYVKENAALILTRRNAGLNSHSGQWALPGGRMDSGETPEATALRELEEEVGLQLDYEDILGRLDDFVSRSGYIITPIVLWGGANRELIANPAEVGAIHRIPINEFMREDAPILESVPELENPVLLMPVGNSWIASPTGAILYQFREVAIAGNDTRVAHYEQPYFAWS
ncbi:CoA pyrophosphatase [bacterium]|nr:CoA pyrophosphatase [bacterium]